MTQQRKYISRADGIKRRKRILELLAEPGGQSRTRASIAAQINQELGLPCADVTVTRIVTEAREAAAKTGKSPKPRDTLQVVSKPILQESIERVLRHMQARGLSEIRIHASGEVEITKTEQEKFRL